MIGNWELNGEPRPAVYLAYSRAYLHAAVVNLERMVSGSEEAAFSWPDVAVCLLLKTHAEEVFFKGAILAKTNSLVTGHSLRKLSEKYNELYRDEGLEWPFKLSFEFSGLSDDELQEVIAKVPDASLRYRYPEDLTGRPWHIIEGVEVAQLLDDAKETHEFITESEARLLEHFNAEQ